jgi:hypothetical protein
MFPFVRTFPNEPAATEAEAPWGPGFDSPAADHSSIPGFAKALSKRLNSQ